MNGLNRFHYMTKKTGPITYRVGFCFNDDSKETLISKLKKIIKREVENE